MFALDVSCQFCRYGGNRPCINFKYKLGSCNISKSVIFNKYNLLKSGSVCELYLLVVSFLTASSFVCCVFFHFESDISYYNSSYVLGIVYYI